MLKTGERYFCWKICIETVLTCILLMVKRCKSHNDLLNSCSVSGQFIRYYPYVMAAYSNISPRAKMLRSHTLQAPRVEPWAESQALTNLLGSAWAFCLPTHYTRREFICLCLARDNMEFSHFDLQARAREVKYLEVTDQHQPSYEPHCAARGLARRCLHTTQTGAAHGREINIWNNLMG